MAPLGFPVVPEVCRMTATSSSSRSTGTSWPGRSAISSARPASSTTQHLAPTSAAPALASSANAGVREQRLGAAVGQVVGHLTGLQQRVHRNRDRAPIHDAVEHNGECGRVRQHHAHSIARFDASPLQQRRDAGGCGVELGESELQIVAAKCNAVGMTIFRCNEIGA